MRGFREIRKPESNIEKIKDDKKKEDTYKKIKSENNLNANDAKKYIDSLFSEVAKTKLRLYESCDAGIISIEDRDNYLRVLEEASKNNTSAYAGYKCSNKSIEGICVSFYDNDDSKEVVDSLNINFPIVEREYKKYINNNFINWLKPENYNADKNTVLKGLKIVEIIYSYKHIVAKYSPNGKDGYFGEFDIMIEPSNAEAKKVFDVSSMNLYVDNGKILKCSCYDV